MRTTYRDFEIEWDASHGMFRYAQKGAIIENENQYGRCSTVEMCKKEIDFWYLDNTTYKVQYSTELPAKTFDTYSEAEAFCKYWNLSLDSISILLCGDVFEFDAP